MEHADSILLHPEDLIKDMGTNNLKTVEIHNKRFKKMGLEYIEKRLKWQVLGKDNDSDSMSDDDLVARWHGS